MTEKVVPPLHCCSVFSGLDDFAEDNDMPSEDIDTVPLVDDWQLVK